MMRWCVQQVLTVQWDQTIRFPVQLVATRINEAMILARFVPRVSIAKSTQRTRWTVLRVTIALLVLSTAPSSLVPEEPSAILPHLALKMSVSLAPQECIVATKLFGLPPPTVRLGTTVVLGHLFLLPTTATLSM
jgi:hypothetical protein